MPQHRPHRVTQRHRINHEYARRSRLAFLARSSAQIVDNNFAGRIQSGAGDPMIATSSTNLTEVAAFTCTFIAKPLTIDGSSDYYLSIGSGTNSTVRVLRIQSLSSSGDIGINCSAHSLSSTTIISHTAERDTSARQQVFITGNNIDGLIIYIDGVAGIQSESIPWDGTTMDWVTDVALGDCSFNVLANGTAANSPPDTEFANFWFDDAKHDVADFFSGGQPVDLGATGTGPNGVQPLVCLHGDAAYWNAPFNRGRATFVSLVKGGTDFTDVA